MWSGTDGRLMPMDRSSHKSKQLRKTFFCSNTEAFYPSIFIVSLILFVERCCTLSQDKLNALR